jgi:putative membrane protein
MRKLAKFSTMLVVLGLAAFGTGVFAQDPPVNSYDKHFVSEAAEGGLAEVELGQLAQSKAASDKVKDFAQKMVDDHSKANQELKECAEKVGINVPDHMSVTEKAEKTKLDMYKGGHFDHAYIADMVKDHQSDIAAFEREVTEGQNPELKSFAEKTLPTLKEHLRLAEKTQRQITAEPRSDSSTGATQ